MNRRLWEKHLLEQNQRLTKEVSRLRWLANTQRKRAELWKHRALRKAARRD